MSTVSRSKVKGRQIRAQGFFPNTASRCSKTSQSSPFLTETGGFPRQASSSQTRPLKQSVLRLGINSGSKAISFYKIPGRSYLAESRLCIQKRSVIYSSKSSKLVRILQDSNGKPQQVQLGMNQKEFLACEEKHRQIVEWESRLWNLASMSVIHVEPLPQKLNSNQQQIA